MLPPHWLDSVFSSPSHAESKLIANDHFKKAIAKAQTAFKEGEEFQAKNPQAVGSSPAQKARVAFLDAINKA